MEEALAHLVPFNALTTRKAASLLAQCDLQGEADEEETGGGPPECQQGEGLTLDLGPSF